MLTVMLSIADLGLMAFIIIWIAAGGDRKTLLVLFIAFIVIFLFVFLREIRQAYVCKGGEMEPWFNPDEEDEPDDSDFETEVDTWKDRPKDSPAV